MMKNLKFVIVFLTLVVFIYSCEKKTGEKTIDVNKIEKNEISNDIDMRKIGLNIEGMTCEIGCARTIQSKLSKTDGVKFAEVNFEKKNGVVEFDANKISESQIVKVVEQIAGGDLYKVSEIIKSE